jgi:hypothetical protein
MTLPFALTRRLSLPAAGGGLVAGSFRGVDCAAATCRCVGVESTVGPVSLRPLRFRSRLALPLCPPIPFFSISPLAASVPETARVA